MKYDHFSMLPERAFQPRNGRTGMTLEGGGGGGPTTSTVTQSNIPDWLRPQTEALLGSATQEFFNTKFNPDTGTYDITGIKGYNPYSSDPRDYIADFTPQEQAVMQEAAGMRGRPEFGQATGMTGQAGAGGVNVGGQALGYGAQAAGMGGLYERMATDPTAIQAYMTPYMQNVIEINKQAAITDAQRAQLGANLASAGRGTYGSTRQATLQRRREQALEQQLADIQNKGMQDAFQQAQQAQQFGVTTGLQGLQTGISGAQTGLAGYNLLGQMGGQMADIGTGAQAADISRMNFQEQMAAMPREMQQRVIDQAIQDYAMSELYPQQQLSAYNALLRGYATPTTTTSSYQAGPNALQSIGALGTAAGGFGSLMGGGKKEGGVIKYAEGGITDMMELEGFAEDLSIPQLQQSMKNQTLPQYVGMPILEQKVNEAERMKMAQAVMDQQQGQQQSISDLLMAKADQLQGAGPVMAAGGGIIAFGLGGVVSVKELQDAMNAINTAPNAAQKQAAQAKYDQLLSVYRMQQSDASDTGAGITEGRVPDTKDPFINRGPFDVSDTGAGIDMGRSAPAKPQGITAKPPTPEPQQGITEVVPPELTREQEVDQYLKDRAKLVGESSLAKFYAEQAAEERPFFDRLSSASARLAIAGNMLADPSRSAEYAAQADALGRAEAERIYKQKEAAAKAEEIAREEKGKGFDVVEGRREDRAKEKRTEVREIAKEKRAEQVKERLTRLEASLRKDPDAFQRQLYKDLNSKDPAVSAGARKFLAAKQSATYKTMDEKEIVQAAIYAAGGDARWMALKPAEREEYIRRVKAGELGFSASSSNKGDVDRSNPLLLGA